MWADDPLGEPADLLLVCSSGGHLLELVALRVAWEVVDSRIWVTFDTEDSRSLLQGERVVPAYGPTNRSVVNLVRNLFLAWRVTRRTGARVMITTGAGVGVPFAWVMRLRGRKVVDIESFARIHGPSMSARLIAPFASRNYVQWPEMLGRLKDARYAGNVFGA
jgi:hypothetical protein